MTVDAHYDADGNLVTESTRSSRLRSSDPSDHEIEREHADANVQEVLPPEYRDGKERFTQLVRDFRSSSLTELSTRIEDQRGIHDNYTRSARNAMWEMNELKDQKQALESVQDQKIESIQAQFDALLRHRKVNALGVRENQLLIKTEELSMTNPATGDTLPLGEFEITFPMRARDTQYLSVLNKTNAREHPEEGNIWNHPHISQEGDPCFGSLESEMFDMLSKGEITAAFEMMLQFLQTINPDDEYGKHFELWQD